ncbi:MAG: PocR ligand-binding domain-containing protein, partial [Desulfuromonadales bacterium]
MKFSELVNIDELRGLCESYTANTGAATALLELDGTILIATGWQDICTRFHRVNDATACRCRESDTILARGLGKGEPYNIYKCKNGLVDVAVPITIRGQHVANFFTGQFFFEAPDKDYFIRQAGEFGFEMDSYLEALQRVPIFSEETIKAMMQFFTRLAQLIGEMGLARMELEEKNQELTKIISERKQAEEALRSSEAKFRTLAEYAPVGIYMTDP